MGTYVQYSLGCSDGIQSRFLSDLDVFFDWFKSLADEFPDEYPIVQIEKFWRSNVAV